MSNSTQLLLKKSALPLLLKILNALLGLIFNLIATKYLAPSEYGIFALAQVIVLFICTLAKFGLENTLVKLIASAIATGQHKKISIFYTYSLSLVSVIGILTAFITWKMDEFISIQLVNQPQLKPLIPTLILFIFANSYLALNASALRAFRHPNLALAFTGIVTVVISIISTVICEPESALDLIKLVGWSACVASFSSFVLVRFVLKLLLQFKKMNISVLLSSCIPLWTSSIVALIIQQFSILILARYVSPAEIGIYSICSKISLLMPFVLIAVNAIISPKFAAYYATGNIRELKKTYIYSSQALCICAFLMTVTLFLFAEPILSIFGESFTKGALYLKILALGQLVNVGTGSVVTLLIMSNNERVHQRNTLFVAISSVTLTLILVPLYGALGAAIATTVAMATQNLLSYYFAHKLILRSPASH